MIESSASASGRNSLTGGQDNKTCMDLYQATTQLDIDRASHRAGKLQEPLKKGEADPRPLQFDVLTFWAQQESIVPALSAVARAEFSAEVTEASSERWAAAILFSLY